MTLRAAPPSPVRTDGGFEVGSYRGGFRDVEYAHVASRLTRTLREKRWLWYCVVHDPWIVALAVVRTGYAASAFGFVQNVGERSFAADEKRMGPVTSGIVRRRDGATEAWFGSAREPLLRLEGRGRAWNVSARFGSFQVDAECTHDTEPLSVVGRVPGGVVNATEKGIGECVRGTLHVEGRPPVDLAGALAGYDFTHGLLARRTAWRWAFGLGRDRHGRPVGFNLVSGFLGAAECAAFGPAGPTPMAEPSVRLDMDHDESDWRIHGADVDLTASTFGVHHERKRLLLVRSDFVQAAATFRGMLGVESDVRLLGVVEDQDVTW